ncbi:hypothetical protein EYF80_031502 [Liparis tanakae]|uniref:Uncharacterized protein n=1 Tax=Liparis tanakae TaxID=230148 RepID=A0A4Z2H046_9TELE|nr:hypothetical protein EYF80_031502 [Liparis tanakae]
MLSGQRMTATVHDITTGNVEKSGFPVIDCWPGGTNPTKTDASSKPEHTPQLHLANPVTNAKEQQR